MTIPAIIKLTCLVPLLASGSFLAAAEEVTLLGHTLTPISNIGMGTNWDIHPVVVVGGGYDSNAFLEIPSKAQDSGTLLGAVGLVASTSITDIDLISVNGSFVYLDYLDVDNRNAITGSAGAAYEHQGEKALTNVMVQWSRIDDPLITTGDLTLRDLYVGGANVGYRVAENIYSVGVNAVYNNYLEDTPGFDTENRDSGTYTGYLQATHEPSDEGKVYVKLTGGAVRPREDTVLNSANLFSGAVGAEGKIGARSGWNVEFGQEVRRYSHDFNDDPSYNDKDVSSAVGRMGGKWSWIDKSWLAISGFSMLMDGTQSNASRVVGSNADLRYGLGDSDVALLGFGTIMQSTDSGAATGQVIVNRVTTVGGGGVDWLITPGMDLLLKASYTNSDVNVGTNWEDVKAAAELGMVF